MKRFIFTLFLSSVCLGLFADGGATAQINLQRKKVNDGHNNLPMPADEPDVYLDTVNQEIIIDGPGAVSYYDVEIASATNWTVYISTLVSGSYGTIDISSLPEGEYVITIDSPLDNTYEGYFETY